MSAPTATAPIATSINARSDALTSERPYKKPIALAEALTIIERDSDRHFDPEVVELFREIAPNLYVSAVQAGDAELRQGMRAVLSRYFKMEAAH